MAHRTHVPKFGNWEANANTPAYTAVFDVARAEKGGKMMNPNDPAENPALAAALGYSPPDDDQPPTPLGRREEPNATEEPSHQHHEQRSSQEEEVDLRQQTEQPGRYSYEPPSRRPPGEVPPNRPHGDNARYAGRGGAAGGPARAVPSEPLHRRGVVDQDSDHSSDQSNGERSNTDGSSGRLAHRGGGRGGGPPAWDPRRRVSSGDDISTPGIPSKSRLSAGIGRPEEPPARGGALPKFGDWDAKDPNAGDGFTMIFQKASVEKKEGGPVRIPQMGNELLPGSLEDPHQNQSSARSKRPSQSRRGLALLFRRISRVIGTLLPSKPVSIYLPNHLLKIGPDYSHQMLAVLLSLNSDGEDPTKRDAITNMSSRENGGQSGQKKLKGKTNVSVANEASKEPREKQMLVASEGSSDG